MPGAPHSKYKAEPDEDRRHDRTGKRRGREARGAERAGGGDVFRINAAHGNRSEHERRLAACRAASEAVGWPAPCWSTGRPQDAAGELAGGQLDFAAGDRLRFVRGDQLGKPGELTTTYEPLIDELAAGDRIMLADGR